MVKFHTFALHLRTGLALALLVVAAAGCSSNRWGFPYKVSVQQGNWITKDQVSLLRPGMTREQVRFALGTPMLTSALHSNRWDYPYFYRAGTGKVEERTLTIFFNGAQLESWRGEARFSSGVSVSRTCGTSSFKSTPSTRQAMSESGRPRSLRIRL